MMNKYPDDAILLDRDGDAWWAPDRNWCDKWPHRNALACLHQSKLVKGQRYLFPFNTVPASPLIEVIAGEWGWLCVRDYIGPDYVEPTANHTAPAPVRPATIPVGTVVKRGPDWKWYQQDGGPETHGIVVDESSCASVPDPGWAPVRWAGADEESIFFYRWGYEGKYDLEIVSRSTPVKKQSAMSTVKPPRNIQTVIREILKHVPADAPFRHDLEALAANDLLQIGAPEMPRGWGRLDTLMRERVLGIEWGQTKAPVVLKAQWELDAAAVWMDTTSEALVKNGLFQLDAPKTAPPRTFWDVIEEWAADQTPKPWVKHSKTPERGEYQGSVCNGEAHDLPWDVEVFRGSLGQIRFEPLLHECTGREGAFRAWSAFERADMMAGILRGLDYRGCVWAKPAPSDEDIPF